jgi:hypothetical protein
MSQTFQWSADHIFPTFPEPEKVLDAVHSKDCPHHILLALSVMQGIVNKKKPRILIVDSGAGEGIETWPSELGCSLNFMQPLEMLKKYANELSGAVLYNSKRCRQFANLACTVAGLRNAIPLTPTVYHNLKAMGVDLPIREDLTELRLYNAIDVYTYLYNSYWKECSHRILFSLNPSNPFQMRDLAAATGCAVVWLDCRNNPTEKAVYEKFLADMVPGKSICTGWYTEERSGITTATKYGLSTVPSDYFIAPTLYSQDTPIRIRPELPQKELENKVYIAIFVSDGDNIQYCQHYMRQYWDENAASRGKVAVNWTISPSLCDTAPAILNYYYDHSTEKDCFVSGPSGMGYAMPNNTLDEDIPCGNYVADDENFGKYCALSNRYFERCGFRAVTVWDNLTENQRKLYAQNAPYLYGLTVQLFTEDVEKITSVTDGLICKQFTPCYTTTKAHLQSVLSREILSWDKKSPKFVAAQLSVWGKITLSDLADLEAQLSEQTGGKVEFVRADQFFCLYKKAIQS